LPWATSSTMASYSRSASEKTFEYDPALVRSLSRDKRSYDFTPRSIWTCLVSLVLSERAMRPSSFSKSCCQEFPDDRERVDTRNVRRPYY
jgi:hypothetical protein